MMKLSTIYISSVILFLGTVLSTGCTSFDDGISTVPEDEVETPFSYTISGMAASMTRADQPVQESGVKTIDVLVYEVKGGEEVLSYRQWATGIDPASFTGSFKVKLAKSSSENEKYTMDFIFNAREVVDKAISEGTIKFGANTTRSDVREALKVLQPHWDVSQNPYLPMWAGIDQPTVIGKSTTFSPLNPMRSVARLNIGVNIVNETAQGLDNFKLSSVFYTVNAAPAGYIIPDPDNIQGSTVDKPTLPDPYSQTTVTANATCKAGQLSIENEMYLFELDAGFEGAKGKYGIVFSGVYTDHSGPKTYFYRLEFSDPAEAGKHIDFLRNHKYQVNIVAVTGPGYEKLSEAVEGDPGNVIYELSVNEGGDINHVVYSDKYMLGVSKTGLNYEGKEYTNWIQELKVLTNYEGGWSLQAEKKDDVSSDWITFEKDSGAGNTKATVGFKLTEYINNDVPRTAVATFSAGSLSLDVIITQYGNFYISTDYTGTLMKGDGDKWEVYVWGQVPAGGLLIRAASMRDGVLVDISRENKSVDGGWYNEQDRTVDTLEVIGNAWIPAKIRDVVFQYSADGGTTWRTFMEGPQGKGHFTLGDSGRVVALYDYEQEDGTNTFSWATAMGIDTYWDTAPGGDFYYKTVSRLPLYPWAAFPGAEYSLVINTNINTLYYEPEPGFMTGCADYEEPGYEDIYPKGGWRLPALQELFEMYLYMDHIGDLAVRGYEYWSSTDQNVTGATYDGSYYAIINPDNHEWFPPGQDENNSSSSNRIYPCHIRCVYGDPVKDVILERYHDWYYNPNKTPNN